MCVDTPRYSYGLEFPNGYCVSRLRYRVSGLGYRVSELGYWVSGLGFKNILYLLNNRSRPPSYFGCYLVFSTDQFAVLYISSFPSESCRLWDGSPHTWAHLSCHWFSVSSLTTTNLLVLNIRIIVVSPSSQGDFREVYPLLINFPCYLWVRYNKG